MTGVEEVEVSEVDSEAEEQLPICVQATLARLRAKVRQLKARVVGCTCQELRRKLEEGVEREQEARLEGRVAEARLEQLEKVLAQCRSCSAELLDKASDKQEPGWGGGGGDGVEEPLSLAEQVKQAAESALEQQGMILEPTSGLYWHQQSGYYFDAQRGLYYNGSSGTWYRYRQRGLSFSVMKTGIMDMNIRHLEVGYVFDSGITRTPRNTRCTARPRRRK